MASASISTTPKPEVIKLLETVAFAPAFANAVPNEIVVCKPVGKTE